MTKPDPILLRTFVEVARRGGQRQAARSLGLSEHDVSGRIRALEAHLGYPLFDGRGDQPLLTPQAQLLFDLLDKAFEAAEKAAASPGAAGRKRLVVSTLGSFAKGWLTPRLSGFSKKHPEVAMRVDTDAHLIDFSRERVDVAIRHGLGVYPGLETTRLFAVPLVVVAAPALLATGPKLKEPADCVTYPLLRIRHRPYWHLWFKALGLGGRSVVSMTENGPQFDTDQELLGAVLAGMGLALVDPEMVRDHLETGTLVQALDIPWPDRFAYYLVGPPESMKAKQVGAFRTWLLKEAGRHQQKSFWGRFGLRAKSPARIPA